MYRLYELSRIQDLTATKSQCGLVVSSDQLHVPLVMGLWDPRDPPEYRERGVWHYAANKDDHSNKTCPEADMTCYFLPHHPCGSLDEIRKNIDTDRIKIVINEDLPEEGEIYRLSLRNAGSIVVHSKMQSNFLTSLCQATIVAKVSCL
jgi:hypothetical protein